MPAPIAEIAFQNKAVVYERIRQLTGRAVDVCPCCGGQMIEIGRIPRTATFRNAPVWNTS